ncbi:MAG TPA: radical SAM protein [Candidatus Kapabacteria bacterium]|nr:radical SAM protein [Candidatus Kapabacteria bacterium]
MLANNQNQPFIKKFQANNIKYIYDVNTNEIFGVNNVFYDIIDEINNHDLRSIIEKFKDKYSQAEIEKSYHEIKKAITENGYFSSLRPDIICPYKKEDVKHTLGSSIYQLILEVTNNCNLRCKYCTFSGRYSLNRIHGTDNMTFETAKKAITFFMKKCDSFAGHPPAITFYGGEPLLKFDMIKKIIQYVNDMGKKEKFFFKFTTNGTLLTKEIIKFLVDNDISILISLDGCKQVQDRYRVYKNGYGTFDTIMKNIQFIKKHHLEYFNKKVSFIATLAPPYDFKSFSDFFYHNDFFAGLQEKIKFSLVDAYETTFFKDFGLEKLEKEFSQKRPIFFENYKQALLTGRYNDLTFEKQIFNKSFYNLVRRPMNRMRDKFVALGSCFPGQRRLFINTAGKFFICERVGADYEIGDVDNGFDFDTIYQFMLKFADFFKECKYCWALRLCKKCFPEIKRGAEFDESRKQELCKHTLKAIEQNLIAYCELKEKNPDAFDPFKNIVIA